ncbi:transcriptional regulator [Oceanobacillus picturae]|jgi:transcriptional repressor NrdR|uniref:Transcriptional repressor NrdR n=2 Tax=Oceanobacillus TaxID=182709 RepID=W9A7B2_9BACI|nr:MULTISPECIES: transcriptional regulator NrdR [Oceanobacillus]AVQ99595.1 transcriptional regulator NrdR [Oceanobacillus iheyensis]MCG3420138.1 transcriptional regulator NrdR [Oceanobacillus jordanicus]RIU93750.1 transcriptional regulator NrdR [Oceanobacillus picturae]CDO01664.1 Transcriptional repressor NrdR [Oceanobacillus picturae]GAQ18926.1 transcriptional regulator [Oceanobacillus picturae]
MRCSNCQYKSTKVLDSRPIEEGRSIRRRRECEACGFRFTTFERIEEVPLIIVKKDGTRQEYSREKLIRGLIKACEKRPVPLEKIEAVAIDVEKELRNTGMSEIDSNEIGEMVMDRLSEVDEVAYVRFASVYRQFKDISVFFDELKDLIKTDKNDGTRSKP